MFHAQTGHDAMTDYEETRDRLVAQLAWWRDQVTLHKRIVEDMRADVEDSWYQLGELDGREGK